MLMKLYTQKDFDQNRAARRKETLRALLCALPFLAVAVAGYLLRMQLVCIVGCVLCGAVLIFLYDARIAPAVRYGSFLHEAHSGMSRRTLGTLVRVGSDPVYEDGVNFHEVILNVLEDMSEEGERRFLLDSERELPAQWIGQDIVVTSHGSWLLEAELHAGGGAA